MKLGVAQRAFLQRHLALSIPLVHFGHLGGIGLSRGVKLIFQLLGVGLQLQHARDLRFDGIAKHVHLPNHRPGLIGTFGNPARGEQINGAVHPLCVGGILVRPVLVGLQVSELQQQRIHFRPELLPGRSQGVPPSRIGPFPGAFHRSDGCLRIARAQPFPVLTSVARVLQHTRIVGFGARVLGAGDRHRRLPPGLGESCRLIGGGRNVQLRQFRRLGARLGRGRAIDERQRTQYQGGESTELQSNPSKVRCACCPPGRARCARRKAEPRPLRSPCRTRAACSRPDAGSPLRRPGSHGAAARGR